MSVVAGSLKKKEVITRTVTQPAVATATVQVAYIDSSSSHARLTAIKTLLIWSSQSGVMGFIFFFQAEDGIRDFHVTGVQMCALPISRFGAWELGGDVALHGRERQPDEVFGISRGIWLVRATDPDVVAAGQDGGLVSALLIWGLRNGRIEGALTSRRSRARLWDAEPFLATTPAEVLEAAGSRYTYSANPLAMRQAEERGLQRLALVGTGCQAAMNGTLQARRVNKYARRIELTIGLLCSKTFEYEGMRKVIEEHGVPMADVAKLDIKGKLLVCRRSTGDP